MSSYWLALNQDVNCLTVEQVNKGGRSAKGSDATEAVHHLPILSKHVVAAAAVVLVTSKGWGDVIRTAVGASIPVAMLISGWR